MVLAENWFERRLFDESVSKLSNYFELLIHVDQSVSVAVDDEVATEERNAIDSDLVEMVFEETSQFKEVNESGVWGRQVH